MAATPKPDTIHGDAYAVIPASDQPGGAPELELDGSCLRETIERMAAGGAWGKPMSRPALKDIRRQAEGFIEDAVRHYGSRVAPGEVGKGGTMRTNGAPPMSGEGPTGLVYGRIQSGKTAAMVVTTALAIDNGFRVVVVLTSNNVELVSQTATRFRALGGTRVVASDEGTSDEYTWEKDRELIRSRIGKRGVVFVCAKEDDHLANLIGFLKDIGASAYPALIIDDEADHATPDTSLAKRRSKRSAAGKKPAHGSTTFRLVVGNDHEDHRGFSLREVLSHNVFLQLTATPYGLFLQNLDSALRPAFPRLLHPGEGYTGGDVFFGKGKVGEKASPPLVYVAEDEADTIRAGAGEAPDGLRRSIAFFLLAALAHKAKHGAPPGGYKHLCHTSQTTAEHRVTARLIRQYCDALLAKYDVGPEAVEALPEFVGAHAELRRTAPDAPDLATLVAAVGEELDRRDVLEINSEGVKLKFVERLNFVVGGNILGRGITIDDLLVTYYLRQAKVSQMDTVHQHARMYGYRGLLMPYTRVYLPKSLAERFKAIHESEVALRDLIDETDLDGAPHIGVAVNLNLRATRPGILDLANISAFRAGQQVYPVEPASDPKVIRSSVMKIDALLSALRGAAKDSDFTEVSIQDMAELIGLVVVEKRTDRDWDPEMLAQCLRAIGPRYGGTGLLTVRRMARQQPVLENGALSGDEQREARASKKPVLFMLWDDEKPAPRRPKSPWKSRFWYPTVVFPKNMPLAVYNRTRPS